MRMQDVVKTTGVQTLRHYDVIGLPVVEQKAAGGERQYGPDELLRLQRILILRELGLPLGRIADVLAGSADDVTELRAHADQLIRQRDRIDRMIAAVDRTIAGLEKGTPMSDADMFDGFADDPYAQEAQERWPQEYAQSQRQMKNSPHEQRALFERGGDHAELGSASGRGVVHREEVQLVAEHYSWCRPSDAQP
jgi:DNA-binding transcriptional MerR regulator